MEALQTILLSLTFLVVLYMAVENYVRERFDQKRERLERDQPYPTSLSERPSRLPPPEEPEGDVIRASELPPPEEFEESVEEREWGIERRGRGVR
jgi:hypothetical protein